MSADDKIYQRSPLNRTKQSEPFKLETASAFTEFAAQLEAAGDFTEAELCYRRALEITEKTLGPVHLETANSLSRIAILLRATGQDAAAEPLYRRACAIWSDFLTCRATGILKYH